MLKYFVLSLYLLSVTWQVFAEEAAAVPEDEVDDFGISVFNGTDGNIVPRPRFAKLNTNDNIYTFNFMPVNWHTARELCTAQSQVLAAINSHQETVEVLATLLSHGIRLSDSSFWIGGSQLGHIGQWSWVSTGRPMFYTNWKSTETLGYCNRHCVELLGDGKWNNIDCDLKRPVICQNLPSCSSYETSLYG